MTAYNIPHTICHELSHLRGFMREDEANFIGFLACIGSEDPEYRYSGYLSGWIYAGNALAGEDYEAYRQSEGVKSYGRAVDLMLGWYQQQKGKNGGEIPKKIVLLTLE